MTNRIGPFFGGGDRSGLPGRAAWRGRTLRRGVAAIAALLLAGGLAAGRIKPPSSLDLPEKPDTWSIAFSPDGKTLAVLRENGTLNRTIALWDVATKKCTLVLKPESTRPCGRMTFTPDGKGLVAGGLDESSVDENGRVIIHPYVSVWDLATGKERRPFAFPKDVRGGWVVTPDGKSLIMTTRGVGVRVFDLETGKQTLTLRHEDPSDKDPGRIDYENSQVCSMTLSPDGKTLALGTRRQELLLCDLEKGEIRHKIQTNETSALTFAPDGKRLASATSGGHRVQVWDPANGTNLDVLRVGNAADGIDALAFSPDGKTLALGGRHSVDLWDFGMFGVRDDFAGGAGFCPGDSALLLAFSPDGKMLVTAGRKIPVGFWDVPAGAPKSVTQDTTPPTIPSPPRP